MTIEMTVPSKTFLLGEYLVLSGGPAIVLTTEKRFVLKAINEPQTKHDLTTSFHLESPAGKLMQTDLTFYSSYQFQFKDPYHGLGGFGASTAQFITLYALKNSVKKPGQKIDDHDLLEEYLKMAWDGEGTRPSGVDLLAQFHGGICFIHKTKQQVQRFSWPFDDLNYCLIHTGNKLATHEHLKQLPTFKDSTFNDIVLRGLEGLIRQDSELFLQSINRYAQTLQENKLVAEKTLDILTLLSAHPAILAAKGCGALGADVILIFVKNSMLNDVISWLKLKQLNLITYGQKVAAGLEIKGNKYA